MSKNSTSDRILDAALRLFNENGYQNVPILKIAGHLGISSGHVAYHFKSKTDIVLAVFPRLESEVRKVMQAVIKPERAFSPQDAALQQIEVFRALWRYRFVFNALTQILSQEPQLRARFMSLQDGVIAATSGLFDALIEDGHMGRVNAPNSTRLLSKSLWMTWLSWLRFEQIECPSQESPRKSSIYEGLLQNFSIIQPYFDNPFGEAMLQECEIALGSPAEPAPDSLLHKTSSTGAGRRLTKNLANRSTARNGKLRTPL